MEKSPFQFGLRAIFSGMVSAAALFSIIHYAPAALLAIATTIVFTGISLAVGSLVAAWAFVTFCLGIGRLVRRHNTPDA
jgi:hypothetical protein